MMDERERRHEAPVLCDMGFVGGMEWTAVLVAPHSAGALLELLTPLVEELLRLRAEANCRHGALNVGDERADALRLEVKHGHRALKISYDGPRVSSLKLIDFLEDHARPFGRLSLRPAIYISV